MRFIPRSVMVGFVNPLAILIFTSQLPHLLGVPALVYPFVAVGLIIMVFLPRLTAIVPAPLVAIVLLTAAAIVFSVQIPTVGDEGELPSSLPSLFLPDVPLTWSTLTLIAPYALAMALVGLLESLLTAKLVDDITDTHSNKTREGWGQGVANVVTGFFGGMGGCAMIGQTMINVKVSGARTRISTFLAGLFLLGLVVGLGDIVALIPMAALVAVMIMVSVGTMDWHSITPATLRRMPRSETMVMLATVVVTVVTHNLAYGVIVGALTAMVLFARRVAHMVTVEKIAETADDHDGTPDTVVYRVTGELFFASSNDLVYQFNYIDDPRNIVIDMSDSHIWDASTVAALDAVTTKYRAIEVRGALAGGDYDAAYRTALRLSPTGQIPRSHIRDCVDDLFDLVEAAHRAGGHDEARRAVETTSRLRLADISPRTEALALAMTAMTASNSEAGDLFQAAVSHPGLAESPFHLARTAHAQGSWLRSQQRCSEARAALQSALEIFDRLGAKPWSQQVRFEVRAAGDRAPNCRDGSSADLTARERLVAELAADGKSTREIADALAISARTVDAHLYRVFRKLLISKRSEIGPALDRLPHKTVRASEHTGATR